MKIILFGASGAIGKLVARLALDNGDNVLAYVRHNQGLLEHKNIEYIVGELTDESLIEKSIMVSDIVISTLGPALDMSRRITEHQIANAHKHILDKMEKHNKRRFITLGTPSIRSNDDLKNAVSIFVPIMAKFLYPNAFIEMKKIENLIKSSRIDWTVIRIINPNVKHRNSEYGISLGDTSSKISVSRENVASFIYKVACENSYIHKMPIVFNK